MLKTFKKYFIAHKGNDYKPHLLRETGILALLVVILGFFAFSAGSYYAIKKGKLTSMVLSSVLVDFANKDRDIQNYSHLAINQVLVKAAQMKADDMATKGYFAHTSPEGKNPWYWFKQAGYDFSYAGENLAVNFNESDEVNNAWMNSPGHKANILNDKFTEIGIATAQGMYQGKMTIFVVQLFGRPKATTSPAKVVNKAESTVKQVVSKDVEPKVLSESISVDVNKPENTEMFMAIKGAGSTEEARGTVKVTYSSFWERWMASPKKYLGISYILISTIILLSLLSLLFIEIRREHNKMIIFSLSLILVMFALIYYFKFVLLGQLLVI
jgi:hypothetical protein